MDRAARYREYTFARRQKKRKEDERKTSGNDGEREAGRRGGASLHTFPAAASRGALRRGGAFALALAPSLSSGR